MMTLTLVELRRIVARKVLWLTLFAAVVVALIAVFGVFQQARSIDNARATADIEYTRMVEDMQAQQEMCRVEEAAERQRSGDGSIDFGCDEGWEVPTLEEFIGELPPITEVFKGLLGGVAYPLMFLALAMGSTAVAAEFTHRTMGTWLTFEPRRTRVFLSKLLAPALAAIPVAALGIGLVLVGVPLVFRWFRMDEGLPDADWAELGMLCLRVVLICVATGALGAAAAFVLRHSGVVLGVMVGYLLLVEGMLAGMFGATLGKLALSRNITAIIQDGTSWTTWEDCTQFGECRETVHRISMEHGLIVVGAVVLLVALLGWFRFSRADVD